MHLTTLPLNNAFHSVNAIDWHKSSLPKGLFTTVSEHTPRLLMLGAVRLHSKQTQETVVFDLRSQREGFEIKTFISGFVPQSSVEFAIEFERRSCFLFPQES